MTDESVPRLGLPSLDRIYILVTEARCDEIQAARGTKVARRRLRAKLLEIGKLCTIARKDVIALEGKMEKYGVNENEKAKTASTDKPKCPKCGAELEQHGNVQLCPEHGSAPFETDGDEEE